MPTRDEHANTDQYLLDLYDDPYQEVYSQSESHRKQHGPDCEVYPSNHLKARLLATLARSTSARRVLEIGGGLGYSALWLADGVGPSGSVETIDRFAEHVALIDRFAQQFGMAERLSAIEGEGEAVMNDLAGPYDLIHDDGWFAKRPSYFERMIALLRPGGTLAISNWFLIEQSIVAEPDMDWTEFAGPGWEDNLRAYAEMITSRPDLDVSFIARPWVALAVRTS
jgi:predicted O-methyltransferase YrrM